jgi:hypothetical protein
MQGSTPADLRDAIAEALWSHTKSYELKGVCDGLGMPPERDDAWSFNSKRVYVRQRLAGVPIAELLRIAGGVVDEFGDADLESIIAGSNGIRGTDGALKNLIFAAVGAKPRIVLADAIDNVIEIIEGADRCLVYDRPISSTGLSWDDLVGWWSEGAHKVAGESADAAGLYRRLRRSLAEGPERWLFRAYCARYGVEGGGRWPALVPQVYLHYDPYTKRELVLLPGGRELVRQRMDFLLLPSERRRIVIEIDGKQHYADDAGNASPEKYASMVGEDRRIQLAGYEVFRFGGGELRNQATATAVAQAFFGDLLNG